MTHYQVPREETSINLTNISERVYFMVMVESHRVFYQKSQKLLNPHVHNMSIIKAIEWLPIISIKIVINILNRLPLWMLTVSHFCDFWKSNSLRFYSIFLLLAWANFCVLRCASIIRITKAYLCPTTINIDAVDVSECRPKSDVSLTLSVHQHVSEEHTSRDLFTRHCNSVPIPPPPHNNVHCNNNINNTLY